uniref:Major capsid protein L1 n=1 Tax=Urolophus aurantiacus papillomavirus 1 TaxID=2849007 RepID=A0A8F3HTK0_9PAPI|nr:MAG: L1 [Urolophus aurantiacus papillomavirus 1]
MSRLPLTVPGVIEGGVPVDRRLLRTTNEYTTGTGFLFTVKTEEFVFLGDPYRGREGPPAVPLVSPNQWRCFCLQLPDPNTMTMGSLANAYSLQEYRYVYKLKGFRVNRGGPLGASPALNKVFNSVGHPLPLSKEARRELDRPEGNRVDGREGVVEHNTLGPMCMDSPQLQSIIVGNKPTLGSYWVGPFNDPHRENKIGKVVEEISDGDIIPVGFGNIDAKTWETAGKAGAQPEYQFPSIMYQGKCIYPDAMENDKDEFGDRSFVTLIREQCMPKHWLLQDGLEPTETAWDFGTAPNMSGGLFANGVDIFNKDYWIQMTNHPNQALLWDSKCYFTCCDNTRGTTVSQTSGEFNAQSIGLGFYKEFWHSEVYQLQAVVELCKVKLEAELLQFIVRFNKQLIEDWGLSFGPYKQPTISKGNVLMGPEEVDAEMPEEEERVSTHRCWTFDCNGKITDRLHTTEIGQTFLKGSASISSRKRRGK